MSNAQNFPFIGCVNPEWQIADYGHQSLFGLIPNFLYELYRKNSFYFSEI